MARPMNVQRFARLLSADSELHEVERMLRRTGDRRTARKIADIRETLAEAQFDEQEDLWERLARA